MQIRNTPGCLKLFLLSGTKPLFEGGRSFHTYNGFVGAGRVEFDIYPGFGVGSHFGNGVNINDELPVDPEEMLWVKEVFQLVEVEIHWIFPVIICTKEIYFILCIKIGNLFY